MDNISTVSNELGAAIVCLLLWKIINYSNDVWHTCSETNVFSYQFIYSVFYEWG